jgi:NnrU protein
MLILASISFVGTHFLMSHPMRKELIRIFRPNGFILLYSLVSLATLGWMAFEFARAPKPPPIWPASDVVWAVATALMLLASVLFVGSLVRNPSFPGMPDQMAAQKPFGVFKVTRHPMMWSFALWGVSGGIIFLALVGAKAQEMKKAKLVGVEWDAWLRQTSYGLQIGRIASVGFGPWVVGIILWLAASWAHMYLGGFPAGVFRWVAL